MFFIPFCKNSLHIEETMGIVCANTLMKRHSVLKGHEHSLTLGEAVKREPGRGRHQFQELRLYPPGLREP